MKNLFALLLCQCTALSLFAQAPNANYDPDWDGDGNLGVSDLLGFLGLFGDFDTDGDGVWDSVDECTDLSACNFDSNPTVPCSYDDAIGICGGWCESDENGDGICDFTCGVDSILHDAVYYHTVQIDSQCWFKKNLRTTHYNNGDQVLHLQANEEWANTADGAYSASNYDPSYLAYHGYLYNWYAVADERNLCPTSWHVASDDDWMQTEIALGMLEGWAASSGWRGTDQGDQMKIEAAISPGWGGTNSSGFSAVNTGNRNAGGGFQETGYGCYWTSTGFDDSAIRRFFWLGSTIHKWNHPDHNIGMAVRCIKD